MQSPVPVLSLFPDRDAFEVTSVEAEDAETIPQYSVNSNLTLCA